MTTALVPASNAAQRLECLENVIKGGLQAFYEVGRALLSIRDENLYKPRFRTFEQYLSERWNISRTHGYQLMSAANVVTNLSTVADILPINEYQARQLAGLTAEAQQAIWAVIEQTAPAGKISGAHIKSVVSVFREIAATGAIDNGDGESVAVHDLVKATVTEQTYERMMRQAQYIADHTTPRKLIARGRATVSAVVMRGEQAEVTLVMDASALGTLGAGLIVQVVVREDVSA